MVVEVEEVEVVVVVSVIFVCRAAGFNSSPAEMDPRF